MIYITKLTSCRFACLGQVLLYTAIMYSSVISIIVLFSVAQKTDEWNAEGQLMQFTINSL